MKSRTSDNTASEASASIEAGTSRSFDARRGARDFNDSRSKRYGQRDLPVITTTESGETYSTQSWMRSSVSSVVTRQAMSQ
jgi:hypothetical protein